MECTTEPCSSPIAEFEYAVKEHQAPCLPIVHPTSIVGVFWLVEKRINFLLTSRFCLSLHQLWIRFNSRKNFPLFHGKHINGSPT